MSLCAINEKGQNKLTVIWDLGRKCTYACSYCPPHRKNNWSSTASFDELVKTAKSLDRYGNLLNQYRSTPFDIDASFTGGEPTVNPDFFPFLEHLQEHYPHWNRTLTTNGFYSDRKLRLVMNNTNYSTVSYHAEASVEQKAQVRKNIETMHNEGYGFKVNVMFHENEDLFHECVELCEWFDELGINYVPRVIGDQGDVKQGLKEKTVHTYSEEQLNWFKDYWNKKKSNKPQKKIGIPPNKNIGQTVGRPCCGGRDMELLEGSDWVQSKILSKQNFQDWSCMINWYFLYIHQEIDKIWFHQTCQVNLEGKVAPACSVSGFDGYINTLENKMKDGTIPYIRCPKTHCGCGMCVPKAKDDKVANSIFNYHVPHLKPETMKVIEKPPETGILKKLSYQLKKWKQPPPETLRAMVYKFDKDNGNKTI